MSKRKGLVMCNERRVMIALVATVGLALTTMTGTANATVAAAKPKTVKVILSEWIVKPKPKTVKAGKIKFVAKNIGSDVHELVIVKADDSAALPTDESGSVVEEQIVIGEVGEIEDIESQSSKAKTFRLKPGTYVLFCNITEEEESGELESHFKEGMYSTLIVK